MLKRGTSSRRVKQPFSNHEIVTLATYLLGGASRYVDTEDVAKKANEIAPGRFTWRKYADQINLEVVRVYLSDAKKPEKGAYLLGSGTDGWSMTEKGLEFVRRRASELKGANLARKSLSPREKRWLRNERARMLASDAYLKFKDGGLDAVPRSEAEAFFRVDDYVVGEQRERKIVRALNTFGDDDELGPVVRELAGKVRKGGELDERRWRPDLCKKSRGQRSSAERRIIQDR